jgi:hypothetical protein
VCRSLRKTAEVEIVNTSERSEARIFASRRTALGRHDCWIDGRRPLRPLAEDDVDTQLPLIADYSGALINVSI